jgi:hypothetical protein
MIEIVIENIGNGIARDVRFTISEKIYCRFLSRSGEGWMDEGPLIDGIPAMAPKQKRALLWGNFDEIYKILKGKQIHVTSHFSRNSEYALASSDIDSIENVLEVDSLAHQELRFEDGAWSYAQYLKEIRSLLEQRQIGL